MCLSVPTPAALCLPDGAVCSGHTQPLWDLLSPAWMCQLGSGPRPFTGPVTPAYLQLVSPSLCRSCCFSEATNLARALHIIPLAFRKKWLSAAKVLWMPTSFFLLKSNSPPQIVIEWCLRPLLQPYACCFCMQHENLLQTLHLGFKAGVSLSGTWAAL